MVKITKLIMCLVLFVSCSGSDKFNEVKYDMVFFYSPWLEIDFESKILKINYGDLKYKDTLHLSKEQENTIRNSFTKNRVYTVKGEVFYFNDTLIIMPPTMFKVRLLAQGKLQSEMTIDYTYENKGHLPFGQKYRVVCFRDDVLKILKNNNEVKRALQIFSKENEKDWSLQRRN